MKKVLLSLMAVAVLFTSCDDTEDAGPTLTFFGGNYIDADETVTAGSDMMFKWTATAGDNKLSTFTIDKDGAAVTNWSAVEIESSDNELYTAEATIKAPLNAGEYLYTFTVEDKAGKTADKSIKITVEAGAVALKEFTTVLLGAQNNAAESCASLETGVKYAISGNEAKNNSAKVDIVHYYGTKKVALYAPSQSDIQAVSAYAISTWSVKNATKLTKTTLTAAQFDNISTDADLADAGTPSGDFVEDLAVDDVVVFETAGGKKGVFKVSALTAAADGSVTINIKVEE